MSGLMRYMIPIFTVLNFTIFTGQLIFWMSTRKKIKDSLFDNVKDLFNLKFDVVFYDTTSIYFEGKGSEDLAKKGFSRKNLLKIINLLLAS